MEKHHFLYPVSLHEKFFRKAVFRTYSAFKILQDTSYCKAMSYVLEGLYIGGLDDVCDSQALQDKGVTHILTINNKPLDQSLREGFQYKHIYALDMESSDVLSHFTECIEFIEDARSKSGAVIVHCFYGQSRSATLVLAYLMHKMDLSLDDAMTLLLKQRPQIRPNPGFLEQLELFESMGNCIDPEDTQYKLFKLNNLASRMQKVAVNCRDELPEEMYSADPLSHGQGASRILYKCKKCRRPLFAQSCVLAHPKGCGQFAFDWRSKLPSNKRLALDDEDEVDCKESLFIEPVKWMAEDILQTEGKLCCPKCHAKLGSFNWAGSRCSCGTWITPSFHIQPSKVDAKVQDLTPGNPMLHRPVASLMNSKSAHATGGSTSQCTAEQTKSLKTTANKVTQDQSLSVCTNSDDSLSLKLDDLPPL